jgi:osmotically-inducible protein OsmY
MKTDTQLQQDVMAELAWEPAVHAAEIGVQVKDGVVTLSGQVSSYLEKDDAEQAALRVNGVQALAVEMEVKLDALGKRNDADIARSVETALDWMGAPLRNDVKVAVESGWLTLSGEVEWQFQRQAAANAVRYLVGVTGVSNQISIRQGVTTATVLQEIEAALARRSKVDATHIQVAVQGNIVTLTGAVNSLSERVAACEAAWGAAGVMHVTDQMTLAP